MNTQRGFAGILGLVVVIAVVAIGGYLYSQRDNNPTPPLPEGEVENTLTEGVDTSTWQTYRNDEYGFEFKYPKGYFVKQDLELESGVRVLPVANNMPEFRLNAMCVRVENHYTPEMFDFNLEKNIEWVNHWPFFYGNTQKVIDIAGRDLFSYRQGCYECYEATQEELNKDGYMGVVCVSGQNQNNHMAGKCLSVTTSRVDKTDQKFTLLTDYSYRLMSSVRLLPKFEDMTGCTGVGEVRG